MAIGTKNKVIKGCGAHHIAVHTRDWEDSLRLYRDVLGMEIVAEFGPIYLMGDQSARSGHESSISVVYGATNKERDGAKRRNATEGYN